MKPSTRIREIADENGIPNHEAVPAWIIASYLDEEYEKLQALKNKDEPQNLSIHANLENLGGNKDAI